MSWPVVSLGNCTQACSTWNPSLEYPDGTFRYIDLSSVNKDTKSIEDVSTISGSDAPSRARQIVATGDILISTVRPNLNGVALVDEKLDGATASTGFTVLRPDVSQTHPGYIFHWVKHPSFIDEMVRRATGASYPAVSDKIVREAQIPFPPLAEQRRIAAILDKADALRTKRHEAIAKLDQLLQSAFFEMFGDLVTNQKEWATTPFTEVGEWKSGATPSKSNPSYWSGTFPWVSPKDMKLDVIEDAQDHISDSAFSETNLKQIDPGHLLIVVRGMILAHSFPTATNRVPIAINQDMKAIRPTPAFDVIFLKSAVDSMKTRILSSVSSAGHGTCRLASVDAGEIMIPTPPLLQQRKFAATAKAIEARKRQLQDSEKKLGTLFTSLQHRAFAGEL